MKRPSIQCPQCMGHGEIPMSEALADTLRCVKTIAKGISCGARATAIHVACSAAKFVKISAINNRLVELERLSFVRRERRGKEFLWYPVFKPEGRTLAKTRLRRWEGK